MHWWHALHQLSRPARWSFKLSVLLLTVVLVLYPKFWLLPTWLARLRNLNALVEPDHPALEPLEAAVLAAAGEGSRPAEVLSAVQKVVYDRIPYAFDWEVWGVVDFVPNVAEVLQKGREDCDGRAVLAASLLRRTGYDASLVSDMVHVWVVTPMGETMSPGQGPKVLEATAGGTLVRWSSVARNGFRAMSLGIAVFPLVRELIIACALCALSTHPWSSHWRRAVGCAGILLGLWLLRAGGAAAWPGNVAFSAVGLVCAGAGWFTLVLRGAGRRSPPKPLGCSPMDKGGRC